MAHDDIAIIGMSCRVAGADSPSKLWDLLVSSRDVQKEITRFNVGGFYKANGGPQKGLTNVRHGYFMDEEIDKFDNEFFSIPPVEAAAMDPQQRILLEIAYEAIENAGIQLEDIQGTDTAVYTGNPLLPDTGRRSLCMPRLAPLFVQECLFLSFPFLSFLHKLTGFRNVYQ
jgi:acyl transferase domain-containing protein